MADAKQKAAQRRDEYRARAKAKGWVRREYYATEQEHARLKDTLRELRQPKGSTY